MRRFAPSLLLLAAALGTGYWLLETFLHSYVFDGVSLREALLCEHDPNELWMRLLATSLLMSLGAVGERLLYAERHEKRQALQLNHLSQHIQRVTRHMGERLGGTIPEAPVTDPVSDEEALSGDEGIQQMVAAVEHLSAYIDTRIAELYALLELTHEINKGVLLDEVLEKVYEGFRSVIPYNRIGVALIEEGGVLTARWAKSDMHQAAIKPGYSAPMRGSSLEHIIETGEPRIINDLTAHLRDHPHSTSTRLILEEGILSSLTCPLVASGKPIGFIFFSSAHTGTYRNLHSNIFKLIAGQLSMVIEKSQVYEQLIEEKKISESLLLNVMPARIIAQMRGGIQNPVEELYEVGVLFADIVGFTEMARQFPAEDVVEFLRSVFIRFDLLCERFQVEKIKTIGDAYMACTESLASEPNGLANLAHFAQEMVRTVEPLTCLGGKRLSVRIGMHVGPVIAGVIGQKKFAYDMWGDTVNIAKRLESAGQPGRIHVSQQVSQRLEGRFSFESRGEIELKGQGRLVTYFL